MSLACGGRGPCCHIGYAHRHCEHCDTVIAMHSYYQSYTPWWQYQSYYYGTYSRTLASQLGSSNTYQQTTIGASPEHTCTT
jgi:hypothetical protein